MRRWVWLAALCLFAFALSYGYVHVYLRGGPRIIDATSYWLEARTLATGSFIFDAPYPSGSFRGRFLLSTPDGKSLGVIFPPGYPLLLALGMLAGAPLLVGPLLGGLLVAATFHLALAVTKDHKVAWVAAGLSVVCAALRYHSADTMSHGLSALLGCLALGLALRHELRLGPLLCGLCLGLMVATRPVSAVVSSLLCLIALWRSGFRSWLLVLLGSLPGIALLLVHQRALTGSFFQSTQLAYYAVADAPPGCFRYGFGEGVGCRYEHGAFVTRFLPSGYGFVAAARNFFVHLGLFSVDATNTIPLTLLGGFAVFRHARTPLGWLAAGVLLQALAYVPFYFDGSYPGGGARFLAEAIPLWQILVARAAVDLRLERWAVPAALAGFALHARHGHAKLRDREGGRPMFEPDFVRRAGITHGLLLVDTDHGFNLGHDPSIASAEEGVLVARRHGDTNDGVLYQLEGRPPTYRYVYDVSGTRPPNLIRYIPAQLPRSEAEAEWPGPPRQGPSYPVHFPCASAGRALRLFPGSVVRFEPAHPIEDFELGWVSTRPGTAQIVVRRSSYTSRWTSGWASGIDHQAVLPPIQLSATGPGCVRWRLPGPVTNLYWYFPESEPFELSVELISGEGAIDYVDYLKVWGEAGAAVTR
ncbi:MAG TPA: hypothetical protein VJN18_25675 [Polyangiaceae bacterium]|nr:hypothetical protein [Polyangiaceae bacterium]